jgi:hypothetical protein
MKIKKTTAQKVVRTLLKASGELAHVAELIPPDPDDPSVADYRRTIARVMMLIFDELSIPLYRLHPELIPDHEREIVEAALRRRKSNRQ